METKRILIVEDDPFLRKIYQTKLEKEGYQLFVATDGEEGINLLEQHKPHIVLLDLVMPRVDGFTFLEKKQIQPEVKDIPVIILSNLGQQSDIERSKHPDVVDYAIKSDTSLAQIIEKIEKILK